MVTLEHEIHDCRAVGEQKPMKGEVVWAYCKDDSIRCVWKCLAI